MNLYFSHYRKAILLTLCCLSFTASFLIPHTSTVSAQVPVSLGGLELSASTDAPKPGQKVTFTAKSYTIDINSSKISWVVDGKVLQEGVGKTVLEVTAPSLGKKMTITVTATTQDGVIVRGSTSIGSGSVDLIIETDGYVHPLFRGKISPVYQNAVNIVAIPHIANAAGVEYDPKTLTYQWKRNDRVIEDQSGYGHQSITLVGDIVPRSYDLSVTVWSGNNSAQAQAFTTIGYGSPSVGFYVEDPLYGPLFNRALGQTVRIGSQKETHVLAVPYGFTRPANDLGTLTLSWLINGAKRAGLAASESIVLRAPDGADGSSDVQLDIRDTEHILQAASGGFTASFNATAGDSASGVGGTQKVTF